MNAILRPTLAGEVSMMCYKNDPVRVRGWVADPFGAASLAGCVVKTTARVMDFTGVVRHIRASDPSGTGDVVVWVDPDGPGLDHLLKRPPGCRCAVGHVRAPLGCVGPP